MQNQPGAELLSDGLPLLSTWRKPFEAFGNTERSHQPLPMAMAELGL